MSWNRGGSMLAAVAPTLALISLAWAMPACCCGGGGPRVIEGPPGTITGRLIFPSPGTPLAATVYAVVFRTGMDKDAAGVTRYAMTRVEPPASTYSITVPPGYYDVIARFDSDLSFGGHTQHVQDNATSSSTVLRTVPVSAQQQVGGIDVGDWGTADSGNRGWWIDVYGLPLIDPSHPSPSATSARRELSAGPDTLLSTKYIDTAFGVHVLLPIGWREVKGPNAPNSAFFANEDVASPINLDDKGVWLSILYGGSCRDPDWRFVVSSIAVTMIDGLETFYFEDPPARVGPQPLAGSGLFGGAEHNSVHTAPRGCVQFIFKGATKGALESNLPTFISLLHAARFDR